MTRGRKVTATATGRSLERKEEGCAAWATRPACPLRSRNHPLSQPLHTQPQPGRHCPPPPTALTEPIDMKKPNVAAEEAMYWPRVATAPRGPGPPLGASQHFQPPSLLSRFPVCGGPLNPPEDRERAKDEADRQADTSTHHGAHLHYSVSSPLAQDTHSCPSWNRLASSGEEGASCCCFCCWREVVEKVTSRQDERGEGGVLNRGKESRERSLGVVRLRRWSCVSALRSGAAAASELLARARRQYSERVPMHVSFHVLWSLSRSRMVALTCLGSPRVATAGRLKPNLIPRLAPSVRGVQVTFGTSIQHHISLSLS